MSFLHFLGKRRPSDLSDQGMYAEQVSRPKADPVRHPDPFGVEGHALGGRRRKVRKSKLGGMFKRGDR